MQRLLLFLLLLIPVAAWGNEGQRRHYILETEHVLRPAEAAELAARGVEIQHVLPDHRYLVRVEDAAALENDLRVRSVAHYSAAKKIAPSAYREATRGRAFARINLVFHDDVSFDDAQQAVETVGGIVDRPLAVSFETPHRLTARIPSTELPRLANDERVFGIYGPQRRAVALNSDAAALSKVTPLYDAPYNLSGQGVVLSLFELSPAESTHPEFQGRLTNHFSGPANDATHATHVAGTIMAAGLNPLAKGMAPAATIHEFNANDDTAVFLNNKETALQSLHVVADNNSWGFPLGWQQDGSVDGGQVWYGAVEYFGGYDGFYSTPYDKVAKNGPVLFVHSAGNDGSNGFPSLDASNWSRHAHADDSGNIIKNEIFCYSKDGSGTDCPAPPCSAGPTHCETTPHPTYGPFATIGFIASLKNAVAVGAVNLAGDIASFSSRGPTRDSRVKPDLVALGVRQFSTVPNGGYSAQPSGTSMSAPVVTGIAGILTEQWRRSFNNQDPTPAILKTLLIAGADDLGNPGPDYTFGFGLANAKASVDLIRADNGGSRIRTGTIAQGQPVETTFGINVPQDVRVVLGWADPEVLLSPDDLADKTLINDLDLKVIDPSGNTVFPYILNKNTPDAPATRGVNTADNTEEIEIRAAAPGTYRVIVAGTTIPVGPTQPYVLITNAALGTTALPCSDAFEPNDSEATAYGFLPSGQAVVAKTCSTSDVDFFKIRVTAAGPLSIAVTATDTPIRVTLSGNGITPVVADVGAGGTATVATQVTSAAADFVLKVEPTGTIGPNATYTLTPTFNFVIPPRKRASRH
jgi:hypothetical protein